MRHDVSLQKYQGGNLCYIVKCFLTVTFCWLSDQLANLWTCYLLVWSKRNLLTSKTESSRLWWEWYCPVYINDNFSIFSVKTVKWVVRKESTSNRGAGIVTESSRTKQYLFNIRRNGSVVLDLSFIREKASVFSRGPIPRSDYYTVITYDSLVSLGFLLLWL